MSSDFKSSSLEISRPNAQALRKALKDDLALLARDVTLREFMGLQKKVFAATDKFALDRQMKFIEWTTERGWGKAPQTVNLGMDEGSAEFILSKLADEAAKIDALETEILPNDEDEGKVS